MDVDNAARHRLHTSAKRTLGDEEGDTLMELLPPKWEDFATKHDLTDLRKDMTAVIHETVTKQTYTLLFSTSALVIALAGAMVGTR